MGNGDAARLVAGSLDQLGYGLSRLSPQRSGYITAEDFERITGEELDESSAQGRRIMTDLAVQHRCTIHTPPIERRVYFTKW
jgi:predicted phage gp36 major capsid-like protein